MQAQGFSITDQEQECTNQIIFCGDDYLKACQGADSIVIMTEWDQFKEYDYKEIRANMNSQLASIYDLRSYLDLKGLKERGFEKVFKLGVGFM